MMAALTIWMDSALDTEGPEEDDDDDDDDEDDEDGCCG